MQARPAAPSIRDCPATWVQGATVVIGEHFLIDLTILAVIFGNLEFTDSKTTAVGIVPTLMIGAQI